MWRIPYLGKRNQVNQKAASWDNTGRMRQASKDRANREYHLSIVCIITGSPEQPWEGRAVCD